MNIILIAPPAAGKGTQSELLVEKYEITHVSTGEILREIAGSGTELGNKIAKTIKEGILVDDETVFKALETKLLELNSVNGHVFDGFPRNVNQAIKLDEMLGRLNQKADYVIYLEIEKERAMQRTLGRITCPKCEAIYNIYKHTFTVPGHCNKCGAELIKRSDDNEESFNTRFDTYMKNVQPVMEYYGSKGLLHTVKACEEKEDTFAEIEKIIEG
jgi:adenylate kinase